MAQKISLPKQGRPLVYFIPLGEEAREKCFALATLCRHDRIGAEIELHAKKMQTALQNATRAEATYCAIIGSDELQKGLVQLKHLETREQREVRFDHLLTSRSLPMFKYLFLLCFVLYRICRREIARCRENFGSDGTSDWEKPPISRVSMSISPQSSKGMQDAAQGKASPLSEDECVQGIASLQEESLTATSEKNLQEATLFLEKNKTEKEIVSLEEGKLQYKITRKRRRGSGATLQLSYRAIQGELSQWADFWHKQWR